MKKNIASAITLWLFSSSLPMLVWSQSGPEYIATGIMNGNQVKSVFGNWGVIGQPADQANRGAWKNPNNGYLGDVSPLVGAEVKSDGITFHSVVTCPFYPTQRPAANQDRDPISNKWWTFEPVGGYFNANQQKVAMSSDVNSWPPFWPDKLEDQSDPGWRKNPDPSLSKYAAWNGYFGKKINADQEAYFVMDDNNDERFNKSANNTLGVAFKPDANNAQRNGLGLEVRVRAMQWSQFLAKDNIFWLYEITNSGTANYDRVVFGMLVGTYVGVTSTEDYREYADDWSFYDVNTNITYTGDFGRQIANPLWVGPVGMVGYAFLESPGNPYDGIDNDGDSDSSSVGVLAPKFTAASFDTTLLTAGSNIILIGNDFSRHIFPIPNNVDSVQVWTRGMKDSLWIHPGITKVVEGNLVSDALGNQFINPNAYDGIDNNFNGLIDENYFIHYRQIKRTRTTPPVTLIDVLRPLRYIDYFTGQGLSPYSMIDEKRNDRIDNNHNWNILLDDVGRDGIKGTGDFGEADGLPTSGFDDQGNDTGLPGEPHIDKTDVKESDQIGLTSFFYFAPSNQVALGNDESLWKDLAPGYFDVPASIINNRPAAGEDGDFIYGSGYFPLLAKSTERFSLALVYGGGKGGSVDDDIADLLKNKKTVQKIYDANYQFPQPPDKPTLSVVPGDKQVTLYWDRKAETSVDPVLLTQDFEGYKIYKSTEPTFSDIFTITDGSGSPQGYMPLKQFDVRDSTKGYFHLLPELYDATSGFAFYLGDDTGLQHSYVDHEVDNGRRYYYALVAYDKGDEYLGILPAENTKFVTVSPSGEVTTDINVAVVTPNAKSAGYVLPKSSDTLIQKSHFGTGSVTYQVVDPTKITGHSYRVEFLDSQNDGADNNGNGLTDAADSTEGTRTTSFYFVSDLNDISESFVSADTGVVALSRSHQIPSTFVVRNQQGTVISPSAYKVDTVRGTIRGTSASSLPKGTYTATYRYYPVFRSPNMQGTPYLVESKDADIFDGVELVFKNDWSAQVISNIAQWVGGKDPYRFSISPLQTEISGPPVIKFQGIRKPSDYTIIFSNTIADTSYPDPDLQPAAIPVNFRVYNETDSTFVKFIFADVDGNGKLSPQDEIVFLEEGANGNLVYTWDIKFVNKLLDPPDTTYQLGTGDELVLKTLKPFRKGDVLEFSTVPPHVDNQAAQKTLQRVRAVPNPYVTASAFEPPLNPGVTSGRGQRKIDFIHVPAGATIRIFTARGDHIRTLHHDSNIEDGAVSWDLKTEENLDIAFGVYFYVVESPVGNTTGKIAIIK